MQTSQNATRWQMLLLPGITSITAGAHRAGSDYSDRSNLAVEFISWNFYESNLPEVNFEIILLSTLY